MDTNPHQLESESTTKIEQAKDLYDHCKLKECISYVDEKDQNLCFPHHQTMQMFKGLCYFESQLLTEAFKCFDDIIEESKLQKDGRVEEVDVLIRIMYQLQLIYYCTQMAQQQNHFLLKVTEDYKEQNSQSYQQDVFLFGMGTYYFIEAGRGVRSLLAQENLFAALELSEKYKQEIIMMIGNSYLFSDQQENALKWYQKLYNLNPHYPSAANNYAACLDQFSQYDQVEQLYLEDEKMRGFSPLVLSNLINHYDVNKKSTKFQEYFDKLSSLDQKQSFAISKYGSYLLDIGQQSKGIENLKLAINLEPKVLVPYDNLISCYYNNNDLEEATNIIKICIELYPKDGFYHTQLATVYFNHNEIELAEFYEKSSLELKGHPKQKQKAYIQLGEIYSQRNEYTKAFQSCLNATNYQIYNRSDFFNKIIAKMNMMVINRFISLKDVIRLTNDHEGICFSRILQFSTYSNELKDLYVYKLDTFRIYLMIKAYTKYVEEHLTFKSSTQFWDLFLD